MGFPLPTPHSGVAGLALATPHLRLGTYKQVDGNNGTPPFVNKGHSCYDRTASPKRSSCLVVITRNKRGAGGMALN